MGSFAGHIDEAVFFIFISFWWMWNFFSKHISATDAGKPFTTQLSFPLSEKRKIPVEAIFKALFPVAGFLAEVLSHHGSFVDGHGNFIGLINLQHMSIYGLFIIHGFIDIIMSCTLIPLPRGADFASLALCLLWYGLSFRYHVMMHGKEGMETVIHVLPTYVMFMTSAALVVEMWQPRAFMATVTRIFCTLMLGTWFFHASFILYLPAPFPGNRPNPKWEHHNDSNAHFLVALFGYHAIFNLVLITLGYLSVYFIYKRINRTSYKLKDNANIPLLDVEETIDVDFEI